MWHQFIVCNQLFVYNSKLPLTTEINRGNCWCRTQLSFPLIRFEMSFTFTTKSQKYRSLCFMWQKIATLHLFIILNGVDSLWRETVNWSAYNITSANCEFHKLMSFKKLLLCIIFFPMEPIVICLPRNMGNIQTSYIYTYRNVPIATLAWHKNILAFIFFVVK